MSEVLNIEQVLSKDVIDILEKNEVSYSLSENVDKEWCVELEFRTPKGGDEIQNILFKKDKNDAPCDNEFCCALKTCYEDFDIDEYVTMWLKAKETRKDICSLGAVDLVEEAKWIDDFLYKLYKQVEEII